MKTVFSLFLFAFLFMACADTSQNQELENDPKPEKMAYDSLKAKAYGADDYGMKSYVMAFLKAGPNRDLDSAQAAALQMEHLKNIRRMAEEGKLLIAGPFMDNNEVRGIYIFDVPTLEEAEALTNSDPAIQAGSLTMELRPWYGSAALMAVNEIHPTLAKSSISD